VHGPEKQDCKACQSLDRLHKHAYCAGSQGHVHGTPREPTAGLLCLVPPSTSLSSTDFRLTLSCSLYEFHPTISFTMRATTTLGALAAFTAANTVTAKTYDYVIVGGGLTGLVTAARLTEDPDVSVLVLEYGIIDRSNVTKIPYYGTVLNTAGLRPVLSAPEPHMNNRQYAVRAAQIAGGGSQLNGMQWDLPSAADFDACKPRSQS
jgi:hypothetical protein